MWRQQAIILHNNKIRWFCYINMKYIWYMNVYIFLPTKRKLSTSFQFKLHMEFELVRRNFNSNLGFLKCILMSMRWWNTFWINAPFYKILSTYTTALNVFQFPYIPDIEISLLTATGTKVVRDECMGSLSLLHCSSCTETQKKIE